MFLVVSWEMEIMGWASGNVGRLVLNLPSTESQLVTTLDWQYLNQFEPFLKHLAGKQFASDADRKQAFTTHHRHWHWFDVGWYTSLGAYHGMVSMVIMCGGLMCTTCNPYAIYTLVWIKFPRSECILPYLLWLSCTIPKLQCVMSQVVPKYFLAGFICMN